jgi:DNA-binding LacI/PurR family transcriptional regulator
VSRPTGQRSVVPTLATVAAVAGVSPATASRALNGSPTVAPHLQAAVQQAADQLGYVPNRAARSLVTRRSNSLALVVREPVEFGVSDGYLSGTIVAASQSLLGTGFQLVVMMAQNDAEHAQVASYVRAGHVDGVLLVSVHAGDPLPQQLARAGIPTVLGGRPHDPAGFRYVDADNVGGARAVAEYLLSSGRRRPAIISGPSDMTAATDRLTGFRAGLNDAGTPLRAVTIGGFRWDTAVTATREILAQDPEVDAIFAASDLMAAAALRTLRDSGRRIPDDVAVVGFDDIVLARQTDPPLTTVRQPIGEITTAMTRMLLQAVEGTPAEETATVLPTDLVIRASS